MNKLRRVATLTLLPAMAFVYSSGIAAQSWTSTIVLIQPPAYNEDCFWFTLSGVAQADPLVPNNPWFAITRTQNGYNELIATILAAKLSGATINVLTTGAAAGGGCGGYPGINYIIVQ